MIEEWYLWELFGQTVGLEIALLLYYGMYRLVYARYLLIQKRRFMYVSDKPNARGRRTVLGLRELERAGIGEARFDAEEKVWKVTYVGTKQAVDEWLAKKEG